MKGRRSVAVLVCCLAPTFGALTGCKGSGGGAGDPGPTGTPGGVAPAPQILAASLPGLSPNATMTLTGSGFAAVTSSAATPVVLVGGHPADVLSASDTQITFTHGVEPDASLYFTTQAIEVQANGRTSNAWPIEIVAPGTPVYIAQSEFSEPMAITLAPNGDLMVAGVSSIQRIDAQGTITNPPVPPSVSGERAEKVWAAGPGVYWIYDLGANLDHFDANGRARAITAFGSGSATLGADWDAAGNFYAVDSNGNVYVWDATTHATSLFATAVNGGAIQTSGLTVANGSVFVGDVSNGNIIRIPIADPSMQGPLLGNGSFTDVDSSGFPSYDTLGLAHDGTTAAANHLWLYAGLNDGQGGFTQSQLVSIDLVSNTALPYSTLHPSTDGATGIAVDPNGKIYVATQDFIARYSDSTTLEAWAASPSADWALGIDGTRIFNGDTTPSFEGDCAGGVFYEYMSDGSLRRVSNMLNNSEWNVGFHDGKFYQANNDHSANEVDTIDADTGATTLFYDGGPLGTFDFLDVDADGNVYVSAGADIAKIDSTGTLVDAHWATSLDGSELNSFAVAGNRIVGLLDSELFTVPLATGGPVTIVSDPLFGGTGNHFDVNQIMGEADGNALFFDYSTQSIVELTPSNELLTISPGTDAQYEQVFRDSSNTLWFMSGGIGVVLP